MLNEFRGRLIARAYQCFDEITGLGPKVRMDETPRTGIRIYVTESQTRNSVFTFIYRSSENAQSFAVEKAVSSFTRGEFASQNSENPEKMEFCGSLTVNFDGIIIQASTSGLQGSEDVYVSANLLSEAFSVTVKEILANVVAHGGMLPEEFFDSNHYLCHLLENK